MLSWSQEAMGSCASPCLRCRPQSPDFLSAKFNLVFLLSQSLF